MKTLLLSALLLSSVMTHAEPTNDALKKSQALIKHAEGAQKLSDEQDELSADVEDLIEEQTNPKIITLLQEIETIMADATDQLELHNTDGSTIAIETEIIEKIFATAKKKQQQQGEGKGKGQPSQGMSSMLQMMKNMMEGGHDEGKGKPSSSGKKGGGNSGGGGKGGGSDTGKTGTPDPYSETNQRTVPRNSGNAGTALPREFQKAMDAYNKAAIKKSNTP